MLSLSSAKAGSRVARISVEEVEVEPRGGGGGAPGGGGGGARGGGGGGGGGGGWGGARGGACGRCCGVGRRVLGRGLWRPLGGDVLVVEVWGWRGGVV